MKCLAIIFLSGFLALTSFGQPAKPKTPSSKPGPTATPAKKPDEKTEWEKATAVTGTSDRVAALRKFLETFPRSAKQAEAIVMIVTGEGVLGNEKLAAEDVDAAAELFRTAAGDAPKPIPDQLFSETLSKFAANLYFRGKRSEALAIEKMLEDKADASVGQLLAIAGFYMSVENGSEAKRVAERALKLDPNSAAAYQTLGLANRIDFQLDESAAAYTKAVELAPDSFIAKRGLAEMKRSLGKADDAIALYRAMLATDPANLPARTGLILALFDAGKRAEAEEEMTKSLETNAGNVILLAGAAYWYAAHNEGEKAVSLANQAIAADPRFIWSHIAQARGFLSQDNPVAAERVLLAARRYGNFPTLEYEIASARVAAGYYREAAEELAKSFSVKDGVVHTDLGGRVSRESKNFTELIGYERRASFFAPTAADTPENAARLTALLEFKQELDLSEPNPEKAARLADDLVKGSDKMAVHRQIFVARRLLDKKVALTKVLELSKAAARSVDAGLDIPHPSIAVMADELYENRAIAAAGGRYVTVPDVPRPQLSAIIRGQIEELNGWAAFQLNDQAEAALRLRRAVSVLPADSAWWRSSTWRLASVLAVGGKDAEALAMYIASYKSGGPSAIRYNVIETLYKRVNGSSDGLEAMVGPNPGPPANVEAVVQKAEPTPTPVTEPPAATVVKEQPGSAAIPASVPTATPPVIRDENRTEPRTEPKADSTPEPRSEQKPEPVPASTPEEVKPSPTPEASPIPTPETATPSPTPDPLPAATPEPSPEADKKPAEQQNVAQTKPAVKELFPPVVITIPAPSSGKAVSKEAEVKTEPSPTPSEIKVVDAPKPSPQATPDEIKPAETPQPTPTPAVEPTPIPTPAPTPTPEKKDDSTPAADARPRIVETSSEPAVQIKPCTLTVSEESITIQNGGGDLAVIVGRADDGEVEGISAVSSSPQDVTVRRENITGVKARALFVVRANGAKTGLFQVRFEMPCGKKDIVVKVR